MKRFALLNDDDTGFASTDEEDDEEDSTDSDIEVIFDWKKAVWKEERLTSRPRKTVRSDPVLTLEESEELVGGLSEVELESKIRAIWGGPPLELEDYASQEYHAWLHYFISHNHCFGMVHACICAMVREARFFSGEIKPEYYDQHGEVLDGVEVGQPPIVDKDDNILLGPHIDCARRVWDVCANRVIPHSWVRGFNLRLMPISHAWVSDEEIVYSWTSVNHRLWPVPFPRGVDIETIRAELVHLGIRYTWLDVLCLRQKVQPIADTTMPVNLDKAEIAKREQKRLEEWKVDVPLIGGIYADAYHIVTYLNGLGRPFRPEGWENERHWIRRAWTLQEMLNIDQTIIAGLRDRSINPWRCNVCAPLYFYSLLTSQVNQVNEKTTLRKAIDDIDMMKDRIEAVWEMQHRCASNPLDKVAGLFFFLFNQRCQGDFVSAKPCDTVPTYIPSETPSYAWNRLVKTAARIEEDDEEELMSFGVQLLKIFPHPSAEHWFPSWAQVMQYPDVSIQEHQLEDGVQPERECSLHINVGRLYKGCDIRWDSETKYYFATAPGPDGVDLEVKLFSSTGKHFSGNEIKAGYSYVIIDITPSKMKDLENSRIYAHPEKPAWRKHLLVVCREITPWIKTQSPTMSSVHEKYKTNPYQYILRRVTTLQWNPAGQDSKSDKPQAWLPFQPTLVMTNFQKEGPRNIDVKVSLQ